MKKHFLLKFLNIKKQKFNNKIYNLKNIFYIYIFYLIYLFNIILLNNIKIN